MDDSTRNHLWVVRDPEEEGSGEADLDIVAVHGLNPLHSESNALRTWTAKNGKIWLSDEEFLPSKIPTARIMIFSYNSNPAFFSSAAGLDDQAKNLLSRLRFRRNDHPERPIIFICHSLGGLLVKRALVMAWNNNIDQSLYSATTGVVFFGTPHRGGNKAGLGDMIASVARAIGRSPKNSFLEALKGNSFFAKSHHDDFLQRAKDFSFLTFYEQNKTLGSMVVSKESAILGLSDEHEQKVGMDADHRSICKFEDPEGADFKPVWESIQTMAKSAICSRVSKSSFPSSRIGNSISKHYVDRPELLQQLNDALSKHSRAQYEPSVLLVQGIAGSGKTQFVRNFSKSWISSKKAFRWFDASSQETLAASYRNFALEADIQGCKPESDLEDRVIETVCRYVESMSKEWLFVYDNFDLSARERFDLRQFFPLSSSGMIIVTSRNKDVSDEIGSQLLQISHMSERESVSLFEKTAALEDQNQAEKTADLKRRVAFEMLSGMPLAIAQAGAYLRNGRIPKNLPMEQRLLQYISQYEGNVTKMLGGEGGTAVVQYGKTVIATWDLSFQVIGDENDAAAELLLFLGYFHHADIPRQIFERSHTERSSFASHDNIDFDEDPRFRWMGKILATNDRGEWDSSHIEIAISILESYALIRPNQDSTLSVHPLVHAWTRERGHRGGDSKTQARAQLALAMLAKMARTDLKRDTNEHFSWYKLFYQHALQCLRHEEASTTFLNHLGNPVLSAKTIMRLADLLQPNLLLPEERQGFLAYSLSCLAVNHGSQRDGFDDFETLASLANTLTDIICLDDIIPQKLQNVLKESLLHIPITLMSNASANSGVGLRELRLCLEMLQQYGLALSALGRGRDSAVVFHRALDYISQHKTELDLYRYFEYKNSILHSFAVATIHPNVVLDLIETQLQETQELKVAMDVQPLIIRANCSKAWILRTIDPTLAAELYRAAVKALEDDENSQKNILITALRGLKLTLLDDSDLNAEELALVIESLSKYIEGSGTGKFDNDSLYGQLDTLLAQRRSQQLTSFIDPDILHTADSLFPARWIGLIDLLIGYHAFGQSDKIPALWYGMFEHVQRSRSSREAVHEIQLAFRSAAVVARKQRYKYYATLLEDGSESLEELKRESTDVSSEINELKCLKELWGSLIELGTALQRDDELRRSRTGITIYNAVIQAPAGFRITMCYMIHIYVEWLLKSPKYLDTSPLAPQIYRYFVTEIEARLGMAHWITLNAKVVLTVLHHHYGEKEAARKLEHETLLRSLYWDKRRFITEVVQRYTGVDKALLTDIELAPGAAMAKIMILYRCREWHADLIRLYDLELKLRTRWFGITNNSAARFLKPAALEYALANKEYKISLILEELQRACENGDEDVQIAVVLQARAITLWLAQFELFSGALLVSEWTFKHLGALVDEEDRVIMLDDVISISKSLGKMDLVTKYEEVKANVQKQAPQ